MTKRSELNVESPLSPLIEVVEVLPMNSVFSVERAVVEAPPVTKSDVRLPRDVNDEVRMPAPRVLEVKTSVPAIWYLVWVLILPFAVVVALPPTAM